MQINYQTREFTTVSGKGGFIGQEKQLVQVSPPASGTATGIAGTVAWDAGYIYVCTATDTWKRTTISGGW